MAEEDDNKRAKRHQKDAKGILLFVSSHTCLHSSELILDRTIVDSMESTGTTP